MFLGGVENGVFHVNGKGRILNHFTQENGLQNNTALNLFIDDEKNVWAGLDNGLSVGGGDWPHTGEIDIMEYVGETDWIGVALHGPGYSGETLLVNKFFFPEEEDVTAWHVYSVDWSPEGFIFKVDGRLIYRVTKPMVEHYGRWAFDNPKFLILNLALGGAYPYKINGVKEPYNCLPASTVELIQEGKAEVLVDWVLITK